MMSEFLGSWVLILNPIVQIMDFVVNRNEVLFWFYERLCEVMCAKFRVIVDRNPGLSELESPRGFFCKISSLAIL